MDFAGRLPKRPWFYIDNTTVHGFLKDRVSDISRLMYIALRKASEHGSSFSEQTTDIVRHINWAIGLTMVEIIGEQRLLVLEKDDFFVIDQTSLEAIEAASLVLCAFKVFCGNSETFMCNDSSLSSYYLSKAILKEGLCNTVLVSSKDMYEELNDDRVSVSTKEGDACFFENLDLDVKSRFVSTRFVSRQVERYKINTNTIIETAADKFGNEPILFVATSSMVCKTILVRMLLDSWRNRHGM